MGVGYGSDQAGVFSKNGKFTISSLEDTFFQLIGICEGSYKVHWFYIEVELEKVSLTLRDLPSYKDHGDLTLQSFTLGLGATTDSGWHIPDRDAYELNQLIRRKQTISLKPMKFTIPKRWNEDLSKRWLVVQLQHQNTSFAYMHSYRDMFINRKL
jgi:hypothetical protein